MSAIGQRRLVVAPMAVPEYVRRCHVAPLVRRCWAVAAVATAGDGPSSAAPAPVRSNDVARVTMLHGTSLAGVRGLLLETPELCYDSTHTVPMATADGAPATDPTPNTPDARLFASRTEKRDDVRVAETYACVAAIGVEQQMGKGDGDADVVRAAIEAALEGGVAPGGGAAGATARPPLRLLPLMQFDADLSGSTLSAEGPMITADGRVLFCEQTSDLTTDAGGCNTEAPKQGAPVTYFIDTGMAFAVPWNRVQPESMRGVLLELASAE